MRFGARPSMGPRARKCPKERCCSRAGLCARDVFRTMLVLLFDGLLPACWKDDAALCLAPLARGPLGGKIN